MGFTTGDMEWDDTGALKLSNSHPGSKVSIKVRLVSSKEDVEYDDKGSTRILPPIYIHTHLYLYLFVYI